MLRKVKLAIDNIGTPNIHELVDKLDTTHVVGNVAVLVKDRNNQVAMDEEEWTDDES